MMERSLHLANRLENVGGIRYRQQAAQELRRLHEVNQGLMDALRWIAGVNAMDREYQEVARSAIAKATGAPS